MTSSYGSRLRRTLDETPIMPFIGVYDVFSATIAARRFNALFVSGFGFAASHYGLPDIGFIAWSDMVDFVRRIRAVLPAPHILVDIDDGYCDSEVACHVTALLHTAGASGVILEDQKRPRKCGHFEGKQLLELEEFLEKLNRVLEIRQDLFVVARTDASDPADIVRRVRAFDATGADAILVDGLADLGVIREIRTQVSKPLMFNQIAGGKSAPCTLSELQDAGVSLVNYSTPCLFAAQSAVNSAMQALIDGDGILPAPGPGDVGVGDCKAFLDANLDGRYGR